MITALNGPADIPGVPGGRVPANLEPRSLLRGGVKLKGGNITVRPGFDATHPFAQLFAEWDWYGTLNPPYPGIKGQIDRLIAKGGNSIRVIGDPYGYFTLGWYSEATYQARWAQLIEYCLAHGVYVYPCGGGMASTTESDYGVHAGLVGDLGAFVQQYPNVIGLDINNEMAQNTGRYMGMSPIVRAKTHLPITYSIVGSSLTPASQASFAPYMDFIDLHVYVPPTDANLAATVYQAVPLKWLRLPFLFGEFGVNALGGSPGQGTPSGKTADEARRFMFAEFQRLYAVQPWVMGAHVWALADQNTADNDKWGLDSNAGVERAGVDVFRCYSTRRVPASRDLVSV